METTSASAPSARRSSREITIGLGGAVLVLRAILALTSGWYRTWCAIFRVVHVVLAVFWVGVGLTLTILGLRAERLDDPVERATLRPQGAVLGEEHVAPTA